MKKNKRDNVYGCVIISIFLAIIVLIMYLEAEYEISHYLWILNIAFLIISPLYYFINSYMEKIKTRKIEKTIIIENIDFEYYRDIIDEYSPAMLSLILDGLEFDKDLGASVIYLINKGYLEVKEENKITKTNKDCSRLSEDLQLICNSDVNHLLACKKIYTKNNKEELQAREAGKTRRNWFEILEKQAVEKGLIIEREEKYWNTIWILLVFGIIEAFFAMATEKYGLFLFSGAMVFVLTILRSIAFDRNKFVKTQKGYELYKKVVGLKNYIKDYSRISDSELKQISIWEEYLIYAIILNNTSKLNKEAMNYYKKICDIREEENSKPKIKKSIKIYAILSIIIPTFSIVMCLSEKLPFVVSILLSILGLYITQKGKEYNKKLTIAGYVMNITSLVIVILLWILIYIYDYV